MILERPALEKSLLSFARPRGPDLLARCADLHAWTQLRRRNQAWPYSRSLRGPTGPHAEILTETGVDGGGINFASQDYLSLSRHPRIVEAARRALQDHGAHSAGSAALLGNTRPSIELEGALAETFGGAAAVLFPTGWGAGYGVITALVRPYDHVVMDQLAHACLQSGANAATRNVVLTPHLDVPAMIEAVRAIRSADRDNGILVVTESLFSMDSDTPPLAPLQEACRELGATLLVDVAHDFGALGPRGTGQIGAQGLIGGIDLVMGAFSKTFASNGGFVVCHDRAVRDQIKIFGGPHTFSNALSPVQASIVLEALRIVQGEDGHSRRDRLLANSTALRERFQMHGIQCLGEPSAIVPVPVGPEAVARVASWLLFEQGVLVNLVEFPAVRQREARFRMQVMSDHDPWAIPGAADMVVHCLKVARERVAREFPDLLEQAR